MIKEIRNHCQQRMQKAIDAFHVSLNKIRTGRPHPSLLDGIRIDYYGTETPLNQVAGITVEDNHTLSISPWEKQLLPVIEKAVLASNLGLTPSTSGDVVRIVLPPLTEETRRGYVKQAREEAEHARIAVRNARREANSDLKDLVKEGEVGKDEEKHAEGDIQALTDKFVAEIDNIVTAKEAELMEV